MLLYVYWNKHVKLECLSQLRIKPDLFKKEEEEKRCVGTKRKC